MYKNPWYVSYLLIAFGFVALGLGLRLLDAPLETGLPYKIFFLTVTLIAIATGFEAGLQALILSFFVINTLANPDFSFTWQNLHANSWTNIAFLLYGLIACFAVEAIRLFSRQFTLELKTRTKPHIALNTTIRFLTKILEKLYTSLLDANGVTHEFNKVGKVVRISTHSDSLTQLLSRQALLDSLQMAINNSLYSKSFGAVLFLNIDKFKKLNDMYGHDHGDLMLIQVAERIKRCVREVDKVARFDRDEFLVLLEFPDKLDSEAVRKAAAIAEKIHASLVEHFEINGQIHFSSPSVGVCLFNSQTAAADDVIKCAKTAMNRAKNCGGNAIRYYDPVEQLK